LALAIDADLFAGQSLIVEELKKRFTKEDGFETLWPGETACEFLFGSDSTEMSVLYMERLF